jgi:Lipid-binding putative hydrolase
MRKIISIFLALFALSFVFSSCKKTFEVGQTATVNASNGWWVTWTLGGVDVYGVGYAFISTYNTSENKTDSMWVDDLGDIWDFKGKVALDYANLTFSNPLSENVDYPSEATITNGKIIPKGGHSKTGVVTDSIYMEIKYSDDDPANTWVISGTARTGFIDDDY